MLKSDNLEFERGAAAKRKTKIDKTAKRIGTMTVTVGRFAKITSLSQPCGDFEQGQPAASPIATDIS